MTVTTDVSTAQYLGDGTTQIFPVPFYFLTEKDLKVTRKIGDTGTTSVLVLNSEYSVGGAGSPEGGRISMHAAPAANDQLYIERSVDAVQETAYPENARFPSASHERALDRLTMLAQQSRATLGFGLFRNPFGSTYDLMGNKLINSGQAVGATDVPNLSQVQGLVVGGAAPSLVGPGGSATVGTIANGTGAVPRTQKDKNDEVLSVKDFGAVGNGLTNDTAAIMAADAAAAAIGRTLFFPAGTYICGNIAPTAQWRGEGMDVTTIRRSGIAATGTFISASGSRFSLSDLTLDGNKGSNGNGCNVAYATTAVSSMSLSRVRFTGAKANAGWGSGLVIDRVLQTGASSLVNCVFDTNEATGCSVRNATNLTIDGCAFFDNGTEGCEVNNYDATFTQKLYYCRIVNNYFNGNARSGLILGNFTANNSMSVPAYGTANPEALYCLVADNTAARNGYYGLALNGYNIVATGNTCIDNAASADTTANILFTAQYSIVANNVCEDSGGFGIDAGGAQSSVIAGNLIHGSASSGINLEGNLNIKCSGNQLGQNGPASGGVQITVDRYGGASYSQGFVQQGTNIVLEGNYIDIDATRIGIQVVNGPMNVTIEGNKFSCVTPTTDMFRFILAYSNQVRINRNVMMTTGNTALTPTGIGVLTVPDHMEFAALNNATAIGALYTASAAAVDRGVSFCAITAAGSGYSSIPAVVFSGGGGSGAAAQALISASGALTGIRMTSFGNGYTSAPTVTISGGGGSGATATAVWKQGIPEGKELTLFCQQAETITRAGAIVVENATATDTAIPARGLVSLHGLFGQWYVKAKNF